MTSPCHTGSLKSWIFFSPVLGMPQPWSLSLQGADTHLTVHKNHLILSTINSQFPTKHCNSNSLLWVSSSVNQTKISGVYSQLALQAEYSIFSHVFHKTYSYWLCLFGQKPKLTIINQMICFYLITELFLEYVYSQE